MKIIVSDKWLHACGLDYLSGVAIEVTKVNDFGINGKMYEVKHPNKQGDFFYSWTVWDLRGVTEVKD